MAKADPPNPPKPPEPPEGVPCARRGAMLGWAYTLCECAKARCDGRCGARGLSGALRCPGATTVATCTGLVRAPTPPPPPPPPRTFAGDGVPWRRGFAQRG